MINDVINEAMLSYLMEHAVILKDPQDKVITVNALKMFMDCLNKKYRTEFYTKKEIDEKLKSNGGSVDLKGLAERIPSWQWKVTMPRTVNQTVTATVNGQTYTSDFYAQQGSNITFSVKADDGLKAGTLSLESVTLTEDVVVTVTDATWEFVLDAKALFEATSEEQTAMKQVTFPAFANVVEIYGYDKTGAKVHSLYFKPKSHSEPYTFRTTVREVSGENGEKIYVLGSKKLRRFMGVKLVSPLLDPISGQSYTIISGSNFFTKLVAAWSPEIGAQTPDAEF